MAAPLFYNQGDQKIYKDFQYVPQEQYRLGFTAPTPSEQKIEQTFGIPSTNSFTNSGGNNSYSGPTSNLINNFNQDTSLYNARVNEQNRPLAEAQFPSFKGARTSDLNGDPYGLPDMKGFSANEMYNKAAAAKAAGQNTMGMFTGNMNADEAMKYADNRIQDHKMRYATGQLGPSYIAAEKPTMSRRFSDFVYDKIPGINRKQSFEDIMTKGYQKPDIGIPVGITSLLSRLGINTFSKLPQSDQAFITSQKGYRGPTVFGENTSGLEVDPYGLNIESLFGNYSEAVQKDYDKLGGHLTKSAEKRGLSFDRATGGLVDANGDPIDEEDYNAAMKDFAKMNKMNLGKYGFRGDQINKKSDIVSDLGLIDQGRRAGIKNIQDRVDRSEDNTNQNASKNDAPSGASTVNPSSSFGKSKGYSGGNPNPHTSTGWSGSSKKKDGGRIGYFFGGTVKPKRGLVDEPGSYAGKKDNRSIGERIIDNGYFMRDERLAGPDDGRYDIKNIIDRFSEGIELPEKISDEGREGLLSIKEIFQEDSPYTEDLLNNSEGFTLSPLTMIRRYFAEKELKRKKGLANGGRAMFKNGGLASIL